MKSERLLIAHLEGGNWEIRVVVRRDPWWKRWIKAWREDRESRQLALFDQRLLNDVGLGADSGHALATRIHYYREQELRRLQHSIFSSMR